MERQIERALRPGEFIYDRATFAFVKRSRTRAASRSVQQTPLD